jgi:hypothetical protein
VVVVEIGVRVEVGIDRVGGRNRGRDMEHFRSKFKPSDESYDLWFRNLRLQPQRLSKGSAKQRPNGLSIRNASGAMQKYMVITYTCACACLAPESFFVNIV